MSDFGLLKKQSLYKLLALALIAIFIFSSLNVDFFNTNKKNKENTPQNYTEMELILNATLISYQPYILVNKLNKSFIEEIKLKEGVEEIISTSGAYAISLKENANITQIYAFLRSNNLSGESKAVLSLPSTINVVIFDKNETLLGGDITVRIEPIFEVGENLTIKLEVGIEDKQIVGYGLPKVLPSENKIKTNATIVSLEKIKTNIMIPWEKRYEVISELINMTEKYGFDNISYIKKDFVIANVSNETKLNYITFITNETVYIGNYTNKTQIINDLKNVSFPDSLLTINANASDLENFSRKYTYIYNIRIDKDEPMFVAFHSEKIYSQNETLEVLVVAYTIKDRIVSIINVSESK